MLTTKNNWALNEIAIYWESNNWRDKEAHGWKRGSGKMPIFMNFKNTALTLNNYSTVEAA